MEGVQRLGKSPMQRRPCSEGRMEGVQRPGKSPMHRYVLAVRGWVGHMSIMYCWEGQLQSKSS